MHIYRNRFAQNILGMALIAFLFFCSSCGSSGGGDEFVKTDGKKSNTTAPSKSTDSGADPSVSAEDGGAGFDAIAAENGWESNLDYKSIGNPDAKKGGKISYAVAQYPAVLRLYGNNSNFQVTRIIASMVYESLLDYDYEKNEYISLLASHWKISEDHKEYSFRIDPSAKWADGRPVTADDIVATYDLLVDKDIQDPFYNVTWPENYERPVKKSKYIVTVKAKKENWRAFLYFSTLAVMPAYHLDKIDGAGYLDKYQYQMLPGTGPYDLNLQDTKVGEQVVVNRRKDYWAENKGLNIGKFNFDEIKFPVVKDPRLNLEKFKNGEIDLYLCNRAQWWAEELSADKNENLERGLIQRMKVYNFRQQGLSGLALNTTVPPFDDIKVRKAMNFLFNFKQLNEKLFFNEYDRLSSYFPNGVYQNPGNKVEPYDPDQALKLLAEAGYEKKKGDKYLTKDGKILELDLMADQALERILIPYQQDLEKAGIKMNFKSMDGNERFKKLQAKEYKIAFISWGGLTPPNPEGSMHSKFAQEKDNTNVTGLGLPEIDKLLKEYDETYDGSKRVDIIRKIDELAYAQQHYVMGWVSPYTHRLVFWNKYDFPKTGLDYTSDFRSALWYWWYDADKDKSLEEAKKDKAKKLPIIEEHLDFWNKRKALN